MSIEIEKVYMVKVLVYGTQIVPKHTKYFKTTDAALQYKDFLTNEVLWNTIVKIEIEDRYILKDNTNTYLLEGSFITI